MAHELPNEPADDDESTVDDGPGGNGDVGDLGPLGRRAYLGLTGATIAAAAGVARTGSAATPPTTEIEPVSGFGYGGGAVLRQSGSVALAMSTTELEPNDDLQTATPISTGAEVSGTLEAADVDWFAFEATAGDALTLEFRRANGKGVVAAVVYGPEGQFIGQMYVGNGRLHTLRKTTDASGTHFVQAVDVNDGAGDYTLTVLTGDEPTATPTATPTPTPTPSPTPTATPTATPTPTPTDGQAPYRGSAWSLPGVVQVEDYDVGGEGVAYHDTYPTNAGGAYRTDEGVDTEDRNDVPDDYTVGYLRDGEWLEYTVNVEAGTYDITLPVASARDSAGSLDVLLDGQRLATVNAQNTGGWGAWQTVSVADVAIPGGDGVLRLEVTGGSFNLDYLEFTLVSSGTTTPTVTPSPTPTPAPTATPTPAPTVTPTPTPSEDDDFGEQGYGEYGYGGIA